MSANQYLKRAVQLAQGGDNKSALAEVKRALELEPDHPKGLIFRFTLEARLLRRAQRPGDAAVRYRAVLALDPDNSEAKKMLRDHTEATGPTPSGAFPSGTAVAHAEAQIKKANPQSRKPAGAAAQPHARRPAVSGMAEARSQPARETSEKPQRGAEGRASRGMTSDMPTAPPPPPTPEQSVSRAPAVQERVRATPEPATATARKARPASDPPLVEIAPLERSRPQAKAPAARAAAMEPARAPVAALAASAMDAFDEPNAFDLPPPSAETPLDPERRVATRVAIDVDVGISSESNFFTGFSGDISEGGLFVATYNVVPVGSHVEVSFGVLGHEIKAEAVVCWIREPIDINLMPGFGVRFVRLTDADHHAIANFIHARAPMFFDDE